MTAQVDQPLPDRRPMSVIDVQVRGSRTPIDPNIYGHFLESNFFGNIEGGVFDEGSDHAESGAGPRSGLRRDVIETCRELGVPIVRWPGGNFTSAYHWEDGIGPRDDRPRRLDLTWHGEESNRFGTDEFLAWCAAVGAEPFLVNSCRSIEESVRWLEYTNHGGDTAYTRRRSANGHPEPYGVRYWGIGNEVYGPWQMGHRSAQQYAADTREHAQFMRAVDPALQLIAVGNGREEWLRPLLERAGNLIDYISFHLYGASTHLYRGIDAYDDTVAQSIYFQTALEDCIQLTEDLADELGVERPLSIALDEWNMRHLEPATWPQPQPGGDGGIAARQTTGADDSRLRVNRWSPRTLADSLFYAGVMHALQRMAGRRIAPRMANTVNLVNANAPIVVRAGGVVRSATYHVWDLYQNHMGSESLPVSVQTFGRQARIRQGDNRTGGGGFVTRTGTVPLLDAVATRDGGQVQVAVINRDRTRALDATLLADGASLGTEVRVRDIGADVDDVLASNVLGEQRVRLVDRGIRKLESDGYVFPPHSISLLSFRR